MRFWKHFLGVLLRLTWEKKHALNASCIVVHVSGQTFLKTDVEVARETRSTSKQQIYLPRWCGLFHYLCWMICPLGSPQINLHMGLKSTTGHWVMRLHSSGNPTKKGEKFVEFQLGNGT